MSKQYSFLFNCQKMENATKVYCSANLLQKRCLIRVSLAIDVVPGQPEWRRPEPAHRHSHNHSSPPKHILLMLLGLSAVTVKVHLTYKILSQAFLGHYAKPLQYWHVENIAHVFPSMWLWCPSIKKMLKQLNPTDVSGTLHTSSLSWCHYHYCFPLLLKHKRMVL